MDIMVFHRAYLSAPQGKRDYSNTLFLKQCENFVSRCIAANERKEDSNMKALVQCWKRNFLNFFFTNVISFAPLNVSTFIFHHLGYKIQEHQVKEIKKLIVSTATGSGLFRED